MTSRGNPRIVVRFTHREIAELKSEAQTRGITLAELVRHRVRNYRPGQSVSASGGLIEVPPEVVFDENPVVRVLGRMTP